MKQKDNNHPYSDNDAQDNDAQDNDAQDNDAQDNKDQYKDAQSNLEVIDNNVNTAGHVASLSEEWKKEILRRRTFAIISHPDAGKTTLTERLIYHGGLIHEVGDVKAKKGARKAKSDWMTLEKEKGISITSSVMQFNYNGLRINLLDTPGHKDFSEDTYRTLMAADSAVMLIDVAKGVEERTKKLYEVCRLKNIPVFTFINKLDREGKNSLELIDEVETTLAMSCHPLNWPIGTGERFRGVYLRDKHHLMLYNQKRADDGEITVIPVKNHNDPIIGQHIGDELAKALKEDLELLDSALPPIDKEAVLDSRLSPVVFGSAKQNFGVDLFLDMFTTFSPAPGARKTKTRLVEATESNFTAFVFKIQANMDKRHRDRVAFLRICSGRFERGMKVTHSRLKKEIRLTYSNQFLADERATVDEAFAGDIIGINDSGNFRIGDTVSTSSNQSNPIIFEDIPKFAPELFAKVRVMDAMQRRKLQKALGELAEEGMIQLFFDSIYGKQDPFIGVVGELQFTVLSFRLKEEYNLEVALDIQPYSVARWPKNKDGSDITTINGNARLCKDLFDQLVVLLAQEWDLNWIQKENPDVTFHSAISSYSK